MMTMTIPKEGMKQKTRTVNVHFVDEVISHEIPHHCTFTEKQKCSLWYQTSDYERIDDENDLILHAMIMDNDDNDDEKLYGNDKNKKMNKNNSRHTYCSRGLECLLPNRANTCKKVRQDLWDAVIDEQLYQWRNDIEDSDAIAKVYREIFPIKDYERIAHLKAIVDEGQSMTIHSENLSTMKF